LSRILGLCAAAIALGTLAAVGRGLHAEESTTSSVWDGVYTEVQAARGAASYTEHCAVCHGGSLGGVGEAPALTGVRFIYDFNGLSLGELFERIRTTMPLNDAGGLSRAQYADILAFVLKSNGFPPGQSELYRRREYLDTIAFEAQRRRP
jgi:S-disulfanyl-L-cysteine oxidoreductase SoxD